MSCNLQYLPDLFQNRQSDETPTFQNFCWKLSYTIFGIGIGNQIADVLQKQLRRYSLNGLRMKFIFSVVQLWLRWGWLGGGRIYPVFDVLLQASECRVCQFHKHYTFSCIWFGGYGQFLSLQQDCHSWPAERRPTHTAGLRPRRGPPGREARAD